MTKLSKKVCQRCTMKYGRTVGWHESRFWTKVDEERWALGSIWCPALFKASVGGRWNWNVMADGCEVPSLCPYHLEHTVLGKQEKIE